MTYFLNKFYDVSYYLVNFELKIILVYGQTKKQIIVKDKLSQITKLWGIKWKKNSLKCYLDFDYTWR